MRRTVLALAALALLCGAGQARAANLVTNGDFESPNIGPNNFALFGAIPGWTATRDLIEIQSNFILGGGTPSGNQYTELDANNPNIMISDPFATTPGATYLLSYIYSARPGGPGLQSLSVSAGNLSASDSRADLGFVNFTPSSFLFQATGTTSQVQFTSLDGSGSVGNLIDAVSVTAVPEPASLLLLGLGISGLGAYRLRRKTAA